MKPTIAFICLGNSCRSIMAEALARHSYGYELTSVSAGLSPLGWVAPETLEVLAEMSIPTHGLRSKGLWEIDLPGCRVVVNLTEQELRPGLRSRFPGRVFNRHITDPFGFSLDAYRRTRDAIIRLLEQEVSLWLKS
ncbi:MAG: low molecular weight phosphatase family protein [Deltaproteobacteria bacterium]|nr:low molecular weight phosphatase family protein [Deltaproteobacteria bacterium]